MESPAYEFSEAQNETIRTLASRMKWVGIFLILIGSAAGIASIVSVVQSALASALNPIALTFLVLSLAFLLTGIWTKAAAKSLGLIVESSGSDISNLMDALTDLLKLYYLQFWLILDTLAAVIIAAILLKLMNLV